VRVITITTFTHLLPHEYLTTPYKGYSYHKSINIQLGMNMEVDTM